MFEGLSNRIQGLLDEEIVRPAIENLQSSGKLDTRSLVDSIKQLLKRDGGNLVFQIVGAEHWINVDRGRRAGAKFPPVDVLQAWVRRRLAVSDDREVRRAAYLVGRKIAREGIEPTNFISDPIKEALTKIEQVIREEAFKEIEALYVREFDRTLEVRVR